MSAIVYCFSNGHKLEQFVDKQMVEPSTKVVISSYKILCSQCGTPLEKIADVKPPRTRSKSKPKTQEQSA